MKANKIHVIAGILGYEIEISNDGKNWISPDGQRICPKKDINRLKEEMLKAIQLYDNDDRVEVWSVLMAGSIEDREEIDRLEYVIIEGLEKDFGEEMCLTLPECLINIQEQLRAATVNIRDKVKTIVGLHFVLSETIKTMNKLYKEIKIETKRKEEENGN